MVISRKVWTWATLMVGSGCWAGFAGAGEFRTYHVGNSLTDDLMTGFKYSASTHLNPGTNYSWGMHFRAGTALTYMYNVWDDAIAPPTGTRSVVGLNTSATWYSETTEPKNVPWTISLPGTDWDVVTLESYPGYTDASKTALSTFTTETTAMNGFISSAKSQGRNASTRYFIYQAWPDLVDSSVNYSTLWETPVSNQTTVLSRAYFGNLFESVKATNSGIGMIPVGEVLYALDVKMRNGDFGSRYTTVQQLYRDRYHMNELGKDIAGYTAYAVMFKESPEGLANNPNIGSLKPSNADLLSMQQTVWQVVNEQSYYTQVPEPTSAAMIIGGTLVLGSGRRLGRKSRVRRR